MMRLYLVILLACASTIGDARAQEAAIRVAVRGDSAYVYHTARMPVGYGFNVFRRNAAGAFVQLNVEPIRGITYPRELPQKLGPAYDWLLEQYDETTPAGLYYTLRGNWTNGLFATFVDPDIARALGQLYVDREAPVGEEASYRVVFVDDQGEPVGERLTKTVLLRAPDAAEPRGLEAEHTGRTVTLHWRYPQTTVGEDDQIIRFNVLRVAENGDQEPINGRQVLLRNNAESEFSYRFDLPATGATETFYVAAVDITGRQAALSDPLRYTIEDNIAPSVMGRVEVFTGEGGMAEITWPVAPEPDAAGYNIYRAKRLDAEFEQINDELIPLLETYYVDSTVVGLQTYHYRISVVDSSGNESTPSNAVMAQVRDFMAPASPRDLEAVYLEESNQVRLEWNMPGEAPRLKTYQVLRTRLISGRPNSSFAQINQERVISDTFVDNGIGEAGFAEGAYYRYAVVAVDEAMNFSDSTFTKIQIPDTQPPPPPTNIQAINEKGLHVLVKWNGTTALDAVTYHVYRSSERIQQALVAEVPAEGRMWTDRSIDAGRTYTYTVSAVDSLGNEGAASSAAIIEMKDFDAPASVRNVQVQTLTGGVRIRWEPASASDLAGYRIYKTKGIPTGIYEPVDDELISATNFTDVNGAPGYWYQVRAFDTSGNTSRPSEPVFAAPPPEE